MKTIYATGFLLLATFVLAYEPTYDDEACFPSQKIMDASSQADECEWINTDPTVEYEKDRDRIFACYSKRFQFMLGNGSFDVKKSLEAYDATASSEKIGDIRKAFNACNLRGENIIPVKDVRSLNPDVPGYITEPECWALGLSFFRKICPKAS